MKKSNLDGLLTDILQDVRAGVKQSGKFLIKESPGLAKEIVLAGTVSAAVGLFFSIIFSVLGIYSFVKVLCAITITQTLPYAVGSVVGVIAVFSGALFFVELFKAVVTPKLYVIESIKNLLSKESSND